MADDPHGEMLWDAVAGALAGQAADQSALTSRAKDFLSIATISTTITGVVLNDKLFTISQIQVPMWWFFLAGASLIMIYGAGIWALVPRRYSFAPDAEDFHAVEQQYPQASDGELYRAMAEGYLLPAGGRSTLDRNQDHVKFIETLVRIETVGLIALGASAFVLVVLVAQASR